MRTRRQRTDQLPQRHLIAEAMKKTALAALARNEQPWLELADLVIAMVEGTLMSPHELSSGEVPWQKVPVSRMGLMRATSNALIADGLVTAGAVDAVDDTRLLLIPNIGTGSLGRIRSALTRLKDG